MNQNRIAFLAMIAASELGDYLVAHSDNGYNLVVTSTPKNIILFSDYSDHPRKLMQVRPGLWSTAAGRYQILAHNFDVYKSQLKLPDFGRDSQDAIAVQMIGECHALDDIDAGRIQMAIAKCKSRWASLPGAGYGQPEHAMNDLVDAYQRAGGVVA